MSPRKAGLSEEGWRIRRAPSDHGYRIWANGEGVEVFGTDGTLIRDVSRMVSVIPLIDVPFVAELLAEHRARPSAEGRQP